MGYRTVDEWENFEFQDADVGQIHMENGHLYLKLGYVTILPDNSCNRDIRKMGTNELTLQLQQVEIDRIIEDQECGGSGTDPGGVSEMDGGDGGRSSLSDPAQTGRRRASI